MNARSLAVIGSSTGFDGTCASASEESDTPSAKPAAIELNNERMLADLISGCGVSCAKLMRHLPKSGTRHHARPFRLRCAQFGAARRLTHGRVVGEGDSAISLGPRPPPAASSAGWLDCADDRLAFAAPDPEPS